MPTRSQTELWHPAQLHRETIATKLAQAALHNLATRLRRCRKTAALRICVNCGKGYPVPYQCNLRICPTCSRRIAAIRSTILANLIPLLRSPKHVVLTVRNPNAISKNYLLRLSKALRALRRTPIAANWRGGLWSLEITNESRGWHPHYHLLIDAPWIDPGKLSTTWARLVNQEDIAIIAIRAVTDGSYAQELAKYMAKPDQLAHWTSEDLRNYVNAIPRIRSTARWGNVAKLWPLAKLRALQARDKTPPVCACGCTDWEYHKPPPELANQEAGNWMIPNARNLTPAF